MTNDWFTHCQTLDEARAEYRRLCFEHHPDFGGDTLIMQAINGAYEQWKRALNAPRPAHQGSRHHWHKPARTRPSDAPPPSAARERAPQPEPQPVHSRDYFQRMWRHAPWHATEHGITRTLWNHRITIFRHPDPRFAGAWFVVLDDVFSPYFYDNRAEAERAAFDLLYEKVKYLDV